MHTIIVFPKLTILCREVPIIVGRCGSYLKQKADIEGIFRVSGSAKRMRDLQAIFDEGPTVSPQGVCVTHGPAS